MVEKPSYFGTSAVKAAKDIQGRITGGMDLIKQLGA